VGTVAQINLGSASKYSGPDRNYYLTVEGNDATSFPTFAITSSGAGVLAINAAAMTSGGGNNYSGPNPTSYTLTVANKAVVGSTTSFDLNWVEGSSNGSVSIATSTASVTAQTLVNDIVVDISNVAGINNGDTFSIEVTQTHRVRISWYSDDYQSNTGIYDLLGNGTIADQSLESVLP
jgi:hypothetical protein